MRRVEFESEPADQRTTPCAARARAAAYRTLSGWG